MFKTQQYSETHSARCVIYIYIMYRNIKKICELDVCAARGAAGGWLGEVNEKIYSRADL